MNKTNKICVVLRGKHDFDGKWGTLDWKVCYKSLFDSVLVNFEKDKIDIYFQTYYSSELNELIKTYNPIKTVIMLEDDVDKTNQANNLVSILSEIKNPKQYKFILITRFDILYKKSYLEWNVDLEKISVPFIHPNGNINDCIHVLPPKYLHIFTEGVKKCMDNFHKIPIPRNLIHSMDNGKFYSDTDYPHIFPLNNNPYYILHRKRRWGFKNEEDAVKVAKQQGYIV